MQEVKRFKFDKKGTRAQVPDEYTILAIEQKAVVAVRTVSQEISSVMGLPSENYVPTASDMAALAEFMKTATKPVDKSDDGFSDGSCFMPESEDVESTLRYCDVCTQMVGPAHSHVGETWKERDTSDWANPIHRKCEVCGHEDDIYPTGSGSYGSQLDFCNHENEHQEYDCEKPWGMGQDHDRWDDDYVEHDGQEQLASLFCMHCGFDSSKFTGVEDCTTEDGFHKFIPFEEGTMDQVNWVGLNELEQEINSKEPHESFNSPEIKYISIGITSVFYKGHGFSFQI